MLRLRKLKTEQLSNLSKVTQPVRNRAGYGPSSSAELREQSLCHKVFFLQAGGTNT